MSVIRSQPALFSDAEVQPSAAEEYRRRARRLRHQFRDNPVRLQQSLRVLSEGVETSDKVNEARPRVVEHPLRIDPLIAAAFSDEVVRSLDGPVLRYSQRLGLLRRAAELGISRFEANLLIAAVQHRSVQAAEVGEERRSSWPMLVGFAVAVQAGIVWAIWRVLG